MTHPVFHANSTVQKYGGSPEDYQPIHDWLDETKSNYADVRHRALRHHSLGIFWAEEKFGHYVINSDGKQVPVRYICEQHIKEDCGGRIPTVQDWLETIRPQAWMSKGYQLREDELCLKQLS